MNIPNVKQHEDPMFADVIEGLRAAGGDVTVHTTEANKARPLIRLNVDACGKGQTWIGNFPVPHVTKVSLVSEAGKLTKVNIEMNAIGGVEIEAVAETGVDVRVIYVVT